MTRSGTSAAFKHAQTASRHAAAAMLIAALTTCTLLVDKDSRSCSRSPVMVNLLTVRRQGIITGGPSVTQRYAVPSTRVESNQVTLPIRT